MAPTLDVPVLFVFTKLAMFQLYNQIDPWKSTHKKLSFVRYVFVEIFFRFFGYDQNGPRLTQNDLKNDKEFQKIPISTLLIQFLSIFR